MRPIILCAALSLKAPAFAALPPMPQSPPRTDMPASEIRSGKEDRIVLDVKLPEGWRLHPREKFIYRIDQTTGEIKVDPRTRKGFLDKPRFPIKVPFTPPEGPCEIQLQVVFYYCPKDETQDCKAFSRFFLFPITGKPTVKARELPLIVRPE